MGGFLYVALTSYMIQCVLYTITPAYRFTGIYKYLFDRTVTLKNCFYICYLVFLPLNTLPQKNDCNQCIIMSLQGKPMQHCNEKTNAGYNLS